MSSAADHSLSFSPLHSQDVASDITRRPRSDDDFDSVSERVGEFTVWFNDFTRFDQQLHLLIDLHVFTDSDEQLLLMLKVSCIHIPVQLHMSYTFVRSKSAHCQTSFLVVVLCSIV